MDLGNIDLEASRILQSSMAPNSWRIYGYALNRLTQFRTMYDFEEKWPLPAEHLYRYIAFLSLKGFAVSTILTYISAISYFHKINQMKDSTKNFIVTKMLEGLRRKGKRCDPRTPIMLSTLGKIVPGLFSVCSSHYESIMFSAAFTLAFFGFLRIGEFTAESKKDLCDRPLQLSDIKISSPSPMLRVTIRKSKTDQSGQSFTLFINKSKNTSICPVNAMKKYLLLRPAVEQSQLFIHYDGSPLTRYQFCSLLKKVLCFCNIKGGCYRSHSFRIGAASECSFRGIPDDKIKLWGRWRSSAYINYIRLPTFN